jgi:glutathione S-transferase
MIRSRPRAPLDADQAPGSACGLGRPDGAPRAGRLQRSHACCHAAAMGLALYLHPLSSFCQKATTAFYEKGLAFETRLLDGSEPVASEFAALWPLAKFPLLVDDGRLVFEATGIIEHIDARFPHLPRLLPADGVAAAEVRMWDRFFDHYVSFPQQRIVYEHLQREPAAADGRARWHQMLDRAYAFANQHLQGREWAAGPAFSLADCAAAPALLYAHWTYPIAPALSHLLSYRSRLLARPSYARALDEARPYRHLFPLGAPADRD